MFASLLKASHSISRGCSNLVLLAPIVGRQAGSRCLKRLAITKCYSGGKTESKTKKFNVKSDIARKLSIHLLKNWVYGDEGWIPFTRPMENQKFLEQSSKFSAPSPEAKRLAPPARDL
jgi:hypothetical protein